MARGARRRPAGKKDKREGILSAAIRLFARYGYHGVSLETIAKRAGIAKGSIYSYFDSKRHLFLTVCRRTMDRLEARMAVLNEKIKDIGTSIREALKTFFSFCESNRHLVELIIQERSFIRRDSQVTVLKKHYTPLLVEALKGWIEAGRIRPLDPEMAASVLFCATFGTLFAYLEHGVDLGGMAEAIADVFLHGIMVKETDK